MSLFWIKGFNFAILQYFKNLLGWLEILQGWLNGFAETFPPCFRIRFHSLSVSSIPYNILKIPFSAEPSYLSFFSKPSLLYYYYTNSYINLFDITVLSFDPFDLGSQDIDVKTLPDLSRMTILILVKILRELQPWWPA